MTAAPGDSTDPLDLEAFRADGHALIDWIADYLSTLEERPVRGSARPGDIRARLPEQAPEDPEPFSAMLADLDMIAADGLTHWQHPGWFAYFPAMSSPPSILGELATAGLGVQGMLWSTSPAATEIESHVLDWLVDLMGVPPTWKTSSTGGGVIQMSASDAAHTALVVARERARSRSGAPAEQMVAYGSAQAHSSVEKGTRVAGIGAFRPIAVDADFALDPAALAAAVAADRSAGLVPTFVASTVGTTGVGAVDPVAAIGAVAEAEAMWHHVDAAYAGAAMICPEFRHLQAGLDTADSYSFNAHKWLATNFDCSVFWVADRRPLLDTMTITPAYLRDAASDSGDVIDYRDWHVPLGRRFRALKLWFVLRSFGAEGLRTMIRGHVEQAQQLRSWIESRPELEIVAPTHFALISFSHVDGDAATAAIIAGVNAAGSAYLTGSEADGRQFVRVSIGSTWTRPHHVDGLRGLIEANL